MSIFRFTVAFAVAASAASSWAQLPPSSLNPPRPPVGRPTPVPSRTTVPATPVPTAKPAKPNVFGIPVVPPSAPSNDAPLAEIIESGNSVPNTLSPEETAAGWKLLFDGTRLIGLKGVQRADPISAGWRIKDGELTLPKDIKDMDRVTGGDLITMEQYIDFEFRFDWKASVSANSGVRYMLGAAVGGSPSGLEYQIIDDTHSPLGLKGGKLRRSGALDNVFPVGPNAKLRSADPLAGIGDQWNEGRIVVQGNHVEHWMNGERVLEFDLGPQLKRAAETNGSRVGAMFGQKTRTQLLMLDEGTEIAFRNLKVRPIVAQAAVARPPLIGAPGTTPVVRPQTAPPNPFNLPK